MVMVMGHSQTPMPPGEQQEPRSVKRSMGDQCRRERRAKKRKARCALCATPQIKQKISPEQNDEQVSESPIPSNPAHKSRLVYCKFVKRRDPKYWSDYSFAGANFEVVSETPIISDECEDEVEDRDTYGRK